MCAAAHLFPEDGKWQSRSLILDEKAFRRRELKGDAGQVLGRLGDQNEFPTAGGVVHHDAASRDCLQNHEMVHVPMYDCWEMQLPQMVKLETDGPADEIQMAGHFDQGPQRHPL